MKKHRFSRFPNVSWEIWVSISSTPKVMCRPTVVGTVRTRATTLSLPNFRLMESASELKRLKNSDEAIRYSRDLLSYDPGISRI